MHKISIGISLSLGLLAAAPAVAQEQNAAGKEARKVAPDAAKPIAAPSAKPDDVKSLDAIVAAFYEVISGDAGVKRDWDRFRSLFYRGARMIPTGKNMKTGKVGAGIASPEDYIKANQGFLEGEGFHQLELGRHVDSYGTITQVFSAYEARTKLTDEKPFLRGINSIQLLNDGTRWWLLSVAWAPETPDNPLPEKLIKKAER